MKPSTRKASGFTVTGAELVEMLRRKFGTMFDNPNSNGYFYRAVRAILTGSPFGGRFGKDQVLTFGMKRRAFLSRVDEGWRKLAA